MERIAPYLAAGCIADENYLIGTEDQVISVILQRIGNRQTMIPGYSPDQVWQNRSNSPHPLAIVSDAGWGRQSNGTLIAAQYEIDKTDKLIRQRYQET